MCGQIKKNLFFAFLLSSFIFVNAFAVETYKPKSYEYEARDKRFGIEDKARDSIDVQQKKLLTDIELGNIEGIKLFLKRHNNTINFLTIKGFHPLVYAVRNNNMEIVNLFLTTTQVDINSKDLLGDTPLIRAAQKGNPEMVEYLINKGADINHQNGEGQTAAMKAVEENHYYVLKIFINKNVDLNKSDYTGRTIKDIAKNSRDKRILKLLN